MSNKKYINYILILLLFTITIFPSCDCEDILDENGDAASYTDGGWTEFEESDPNYDTAIAQFNQAITADNDFGEAYVGLGWCYVMKENSSSATNNFDTALEKTTQFKADIYAGLIFAYRIGINYSSAISQASNFINNSTSSYVFEHNNKIKAKTVHALLAECYFKEGDLTNASTAINNAGGTAPTGDGPWNINGETITEYKWAIAKVIESLLDDVVTK